MSTRGTAVAALLVAAVAVGLSPTAAGANGLGGASTDGEGIDYGAMSGDRSPGRTGGGGGSSGRRGNAAPSNCTYTQARVGVGSTVFEVGLERVDMTRPGSWYEKQCGTVYFGLVFVPVGAAGPSVSPRDVADGVLDRMNLPLPQPRVSPAGNQLVNLPMWVWLDGWAARRDSASVPGVSVTVTATPTKAVWTFGDGATLTCNGPGVAWNASLPPDPPCGHTFTRSSASAPDRTFRVKVAVTWAASYTVVGGAGGGSLPPVVRTTEFPVRVGEVQAVNTRTGGPNR